MRLKNLAVFLLMAAASGCGGAKVGEEAKNPQSEDVPKVSAVQGQAPAGVPCPEEKKPNRRKSPTGP